MLSFFPFSQALVRFDGVGAALDLHLRLPVGPRHYKRGCRCCCRCWRISCAVCKMRDTIRVIVYVSKVFSQRPLSPGTGLALLEISGQVE